MGNISWRDICWRGQQAFYKESALYVFSLSGEGRRLPSSSFFGQVLSIKQLRFLMSLESMGQERNGCLSLRHANKLKREC